MLAYLAAQGHRFDWARSRGHGPALITDGGAATGLGGTDTAAGALPVLALPRAGSEGGRLAARFARLAYDRRRVERLVDGSRPPPRRACPRCSRNSSTCTAGAGRQWASPACWSIPPSNLPHGSCNDLWPRVCCVSTPCGWTIAWWPPSTTSSRTLFTSISQASILGSQPQSWLAGHQSRHPPCHRGRLCRSSTSCAAARPTSTIGEPRIGRCSRGGWHRQAGHGSGTSCRPSFAGRMCRRAGA